MRPQVFSTLHSVFFWTNLVGRWRVHLLGRENAISGELPLRGTLLFLAACAAAYGATPTPFAPPAPDTVTIFRNTTLIDGTGAAPRPGIDVVVNGQRISAVLADRAVTQQMLHGAKVVDLTGKFLIPGLIDSHVHLATPPNRRQAEAMLRRDLYGGVTAVRDMADDLRALADISRAALVGEIPGPDIFYAALMAGPPFFVDKRTHQTTAGATAGEVPWMQAVTEQTDLPLAVAMARGTSATAIKLYAELTAHLATRIAAEAHRQHMRVWAHATLFPAKPSEVVAAGADVISHSCMLIHEASAHVPSDPNTHDDVPLGQFADGHSTVLNKLFQDMARRGVILDATVWAYDSPMPDTGAPPQQAHPHCDAALGAAITGQAYRAGVPISTGTDNPAPWNDLWPDVFHEIDVLVHQAHISPADVIRSATLVGARAAGQERDMGSIEPGKLANMVVLRNNPVDDINNLRSVEMTIKRGRIFLRTDFKPLVAGDIEDY
jgi:imidazolonepropionase-like amidohydrolase